MSKKWEKYFIVDASVIQTNKPFAYAYSEDLNGEEGWIVSSRVKQIDGKTTADYIKLWDEPVEAAKKALELNKECPVKLIFIRIDGREVSFIDVDFKKFVPEIENT